MGIVVGAAVRDVLLLSNSALNMYLKVPSDFGGAFYFQVVSAESARIPLNSPDCKASSVLIKKARQLPGLHIKIRLIFILSDSHFLAHEDILNSI